jgi:hypothetical protein
MRRSWVRVTRKQLKALFSTATGHRDAVMRGIGTAMPPIVSKDYPSGI